VIILKIEIEVLSGIESREEIEQFEEHLKEFLSEHFLEAKIINHKTGKETTVIPTPKCSECGKPLKTIDVEEHGKRLRFNINTGKYYHEETITTKFFRCTECGRLIGELRSDGHRWGFTPKIDE